MVYSLLVIRAVAVYRRQRTGPSPTMPFITIMKPLAGADAGLRANLRSFFEQDYPEYEVLFAVERPDDPAVSIAREVMAEFPQTHSRLIISGEPAIPNRKVHNLSAMYAVARYDILLMADSDVRVGTDLLRVVAAEMEQPRVCLVTCPYRASAGASIWTATEAIGLNTEFLGQVLVARMLGGMDFALGPTLAIRREALDAIGGFAELGNYLAEDFVMGNRVAALGGKVVFSSFIVEHRLGMQMYSDNLAHRLRWARSTRRSRPWGYLGLAFVNPVPLVLLWVAVFPPAWPVAVVVLLLRAWTAWATSQRVLRDPLTRDYWYLVPFQDVASFLVWIAGFWGAGIEWRGARLQVESNGRFEMAKRVPKQRNANS